MGVEGTVQEAGPVLGDFLFGGECELEEEIGALDGDPDVD
jgi:hypothetical protein